MKRLIVAIALMIAPAIACMAQVFSAPPADATFGATLQPISNSLPAAVVATASYYYREPWPPYTPVQVYTNKLDLFLNVLGMLEDTWIMKKEKNGSLKPILQVTNGYESFMLTDGQVRDLIEGNFYLEADFDSSHSYLGNFVRNPYLMGPTAVITFPDLLGQDDVNLNLDTVISTDNRTAEVVLDGSHCTDPYYLPMRYFWTGYDAGGKIIFIDEGIVVKKVLATGSYDFYLQADDKLADGLSYSFIVNVLTPGEAVEVAITNIQFPWLAVSEDKVLTDILTTAETFYNRGDMAEGCAGLEVYQSAVRNFHLNDMETSALLSPAQDILNAFK